MSKAYWILPDGEIIDINLETHISYIINNPATFNIRKSHIIERYKKYNELIPIEGIARKEIIMDLIRQHYIRIRQYRNHWSISLLKLTPQSKSSLSQWAMSARNIPHSGKYADVVMQTIDGSVFNCTVEELYLSSI